MSEVSEQQPNAQPFNYETFRKGVVKELARGDSFFCFTSERVKNTAFELLGRRQPEASIKIEGEGEHKRLVFQNQKGETFDPLEGYDKTLRVVEGGDFKERCLPGQHLVELPRSWIGGKKMHQGLKALHELAHLAVYEENPHFHYSRDGAKMQLAVAGMLAAKQDIPLGKIIEGISELAETGYYSLGFKDRQERLDYITESVQRIKHIQEYGDEYFQRFLGDTLLLDYETTVSLERMVWAKTLQIIRKAAVAGFIVDNRTNEEIFNEIDLVLATEVRPGMTHVVRRPLSRKRLGLPEAPEKVRVPSLTPLADMAFAIEQAEKEIEKISEGVRDYLHLHDERVDAGREKLTPISQIDSKIIESDKGMFGRGERLPIDRAMENIVGLACLAYQKKQMSLWRYIGGENAELRPKKERDKWSEGEKMKILDKISVSEVSGTPGRYMVTFRTTDVGGDYPPERIESNIVYFDKQATDEDLDRDTYGLPRYPGEETEYIFAFRTKPEDVRFPRTGWQLVGGQRTIILHARLYARENEITQGKVRRYLESIGYDPETIGRIWIGFSGNFAGLLQKQ